MKTTVIVGAGVTGLSTAYHLAGMDAGRVIVLEKDVVGAGSSSRAAGITTGLLWTETGVRARQVATAVFRRLGRELPGYTYHDEHGCLNLFSPALWPARAALLPLYDRLGAPYRVLDAAEIHARWPALHPPRDFIGLHDPVGGYSEPDEYVPALAAAARARGVEIRERTVVRELLRQGDRVTGVRTDAGPVAADAVVAANYAWVLPLLATAGVALPAKTFIHQRFVSEPLPAPAAFPPVNADPYLGYLRPATGGRVLLGIETPAIPDLRVVSPDFRLTELTEPWDLVAPAVERFAEFMPALRGLRWESARVGLLSFSLDGEPIVGPVPGVEGLFTGICFHSGGFSYNPASGRFLAEYVARGAPSIDLAAFRADRFNAEETAAYLATPLTQSQSFRRRH